MGLGSPVRTGRTAAGRVNWPASRRLADADTGSHSHPYTVGIFDAELKLETVAMRRARFFFCFGWSGGDEDQNQNGQGVGAFEGKHMRRASCAVFSFKNQNFNFFRHLYGDLNLDEIKNAL